MATWIFCPPRLDAWGSAKQGMIRGNLCKERVPPPPACTSNRSVTALVTRIAPPKSVNQAPRPTKLAPARKDATLIPTSMKNVGIIDGLSHLETRLKHSCRLQAQERSSNMQVHKMIKRPVVVHEEGTTSGPAWTSATSSIPHMRGGHTLGRWSAQLALPCSQSGPSDECRLILKASVRLIDVSAEWQAPLGEKSLPGEQDHVGIVHVQQQRLQPQASGRTSKLRPEVGSSSEQAASCPPPPCACHGTRWPCSPLFMRRKLQLLQARG